MRWGAQTSLSNKLTLSVMEEVTIAEAMEHLREAFNPELEGLGGMREWRLLG